MRKNKWLHKGIITSVKDTSKGFKNLRTYEDYHIFNCAPSSYEDYEAEQKDARYFFLFFLTNLSLITQGFEDWGSYYNTLYYQTVKELVTE